MRFTGAPASLWNQTSLVLPKVSGSTGLSEPRRTRIQDGGFRCFSFSCRQRGECPGVLQAWVGLYSYLWQNCPSLSGTETPGWSSSVWSGGAKA